MENKTNNKTSIVLKDKEKKAVVAAKMSFNGAGLEVKTLTDMKLVAETFISSGLVPKSFNTAAKVIVAMQAGREMGFGFWESLMKLHVVNGRVGMEAKAMKAKALASGKCKSWKEEKVGETGKPTEGYKITVERAEGWGGEATFTSQDATAAGLANKDNWKNYRDDMLWNRTVSKTCRRWFDDVIFTIYTPEELESIKIEDVSNEVGLGVDALKERIDQKKKPVKVNSKTVAAEPPAETEPPPTEKEPTGYHCKHCIKDYPGTAKELVATNVLEDRGEGILTCAECGIEVQPIAAEN